MSCKVAVRLHWSHKAFVDYLRGLDMSSSRVRAASGNTTQRARAHINSVPYHPRKVRAEPVFLGLNHKCRQPKPFSFPATMGPSRVPSRRCLPPRLQHSIESVAGHAWITRCPFGLPASLAGRRRHRWLFQPSSPAGRPLVGYGGESAHHNPGRSKPAIPQQPDIRRGRTFR